MAQNVRLADEQSTARRARILGMVYVDTSNMTNIQLFKGVMSVAELYQYKVIPLYADEHTINFGVTTTTSQQTMAQLKNRFQDQRVSYALISDSGFREIMRMYDPPQKVVYHDIEIASAGSQELVQKVSQILEQIRADDMLAYLVQQAHKLGASDIHYETQSKFVRIRLRIDGVLHAVAHVSFEKAHVLISAIASAANVSTSANEPQQGHISQVTKMADGSEVKVNLRVETVPAINGMDIVMRLFNMDQSMYTLDRLGLSADERQVLEAIISKPSGLVMAVGPTGSGKTTTLYSVLNSLNNEERKIITIEDPVEYQFEGITQIPVPNTVTTHGSFAQELRAVLRLDPDIVMVGEIRDNDTAKTALQAALTGHLVLSTFHASSASAAITRLMDMVAENPLFLSAIRLVMAQRLVRRLDDATKQAYTPDEGTLEVIRRVIETLPANVPRPKLEGLQLYSPGKSDDNPYGFRGQLALREQFLLHGPVLELLQTGKEFTAEQIEKAAIQSGMTTMLQNGILKAIAGETTLTEVFRVVG
ncbi:MAG: ATPase, T2SS/T4P/T4SS family [Candidatus Saccharibacteria bacterium]|nr:ATPase, T2SS/T4P/T4SS family [Candidatus Saccharibacteria bacterium]